MNTKINKNWFRGVYTGSIHFVLCIGFLTGTAQASFPDVDVTHPYFHAIEGLQEEGIVEGYEKGGAYYFRPLQPVIRAEALKVLMMAAGISAEDRGADYFPDVSSDAWYADYVNTAADLNIVQGFADGSFHPSAQVSRSEFLKMLVLSFDIPVEEELPEESWYERFFQVTAHYRILDDLNLSPYESVSRGEMAELIYRTERVAESDFTKKYIFSGSGKASYYGKGFHGRPTASGEIYDSTDLTAAHRTLPFDTFLKVSYEGKSIIVRINDRGPYHSDRILDLSERAFSLLTPLSRGVVTVDFEVVASPSEEQALVPDAVLPELSIEAQNKPVPSIVAKEIETSSTRTTPSVSLARGTETIPLFSETVTHLPTTFFPNAVLRRSIPQLVPVGTVMNFSGTAVSSGHKKATVFLQKISESANEKEPQKHFTGLISGKNFSFPVHFEEEGSFHMGLILDDESKSRVEKIRVVPLEKERKFASSGISFNSDISVKVLPEHQKVTFTWESMDDLVSRIDFEQRGIQKTLFLEDELNQMTLSYDYFSKFRTGEPLTVRLSQAFSLDGTLAKQTMNWKQAASREYQLTEGFPDTETESISVFDFPRFVKTLDHVVLEGRIHTPEVHLKDNAFLITPSGFVREFPIQERGGSDFLVRITPEEWGTHVFEILSDEGEILFNRGMYFSENFILPVAPRTQTPITSDTKAGVLHWINAIRANHGLPTLVSSAELEQFAQDYAEKMGRGNFISHTDDVGRSFDERIRDAGLLGEFGENLSYGSRFALALEGLENSGSHRANMLRRKWTKVGIGLAQNAKKEWYVTQIFGK
ncbi:septal ring lytic transglycosylase RlpA family protein [Candidatus Gracilibacteria bacterium]|nr:septal ring lytic transglycosylase RlpA family protein [Candidatus Gracilibacteria bacterium]